MRSLWACVFVCFCFVGCRDNARTEMKRFIGSRVNAPENIACEIDSIFETRQCKFLLIHCYEVTDCLPCSFKNIKLLGMYDDEFKDMGLYPVVILKNDSLPQSKVRETIEDMGVYYPVLFDGGGDMLSDNPVLQKYEICRTFVVDRSLNVRWLGSPVYNEHTLSLCRQYLQ